MVTAALLQPLTLTISTTAAGAFDFLLFARYGIPSALDEFDSAFGTLILTPALASPIGDAALVASSIPGLAQLQATALPWQFQLPFGLPFAADFTLQAVVIDSTAPGNGVGLSNGLMLVVQ